MSDEEMIPLETFCTYYNVEPSFVETLESYGLISINSQEERRFIMIEEVVELEKFSRLYYDLNINVPGIDALKHLLEKLRELQQETENLRARLRIYE
jgi:MerR HTH family regulatory protein